jgi:hypothetical protein
VSLLKQRELSTFSGGVQVFGRWGKRSSLRGSPIRSTSGKEIRFDKGNKRRGRSE